MVLRNYVLEDEGRKNTARIAKAASHKLLGKLSLNLSFVPSLPSAQCSSQSACHLPLTKSNEIAPFFQLSVVCYTYIDHAKNTLVGPVEPF